MSLVEAVSNLMVGTRCSMLLYSLQAALVKDIIQSVTTRFARDEGSIGDFRGFHVEDDLEDVGWLVHSKERQLDTSCTVAVTTTDKVHELEYRLPIVSRKQFLLLPISANGNSTPAVNSGSMAKFAAMRRDFYPPPLILVEKDRDGVVKMLAAFSKDNVCDNNGLGSHDDGVEGISIRLVDAYRRSADRWIVGNKAKSSGQHRYSACKDEQGLLRGQTLKVAVFGIEPFVVFSDDPSEPVGGICITLVDAIAGYLGARVSHQPDSYFYYRLSNGTEFGSENQVTIQHAHLSVDGVMAVHRDFGEYPTIEKQIRNGESHLDYSNPLYTNDYMVVVARPRRLPRISNILYSFDVGTWVALVASLVMATAVLAALAVPIAWKSFHKWDIMIDATMAPFGVMFQEFHFKILKGSRLRTTKLSALHRTVILVVLFLWTVEAFLLAVSFAGILKANFIIVRHEKKIKSFSEIFERDLPSYLTDESYYFLTMLAYVNKIAGAYADQVKKTDGGIFSLREKNYKDMYAKISRVHGTMGIVGQTHEAIRGTYNKKGLDAPVILIPSSFASFYQTLRTQFGSPLLDLLNPPIRRIVESGIIDKLYNFYSPFRHFNEDQFWESVDRTEEPLVAEHLVIPFSIVCCGTLLALFVWVTEMILGFRLTLKRVTGRLVTKGLQWIRRAGRACLAWLREQLQEMF